MNTDFITFRVEWLDELNRLNESWHSHAEGRTQRHLGIPPKWPILQNWFVYCACTYSLRVPYDCLRVPYDSLRVPYGSRTRILANVHAGPYGSYGSSPPRGSPPPEQFAAKRYG